MPLPCLATLFVMLVALAGRALAGPLVPTPEGRVEGVQVQDVAVFKGLPYAAPPVGPSRWRAPQPAPGWQGTRDASEFGRACMQMPGLSLKAGGDPGPLGEDCLTLNVWTPQVDAQASLPVMVWLHGGALIFGAGNLPIYDGGALARRGVVVVTINYRLGPLGYFVHPALDREAAGGPANFGLLDQIAALQWVRRNIAAFGGDARRVTVFGQSAGAQSVLALMASPPARGLFQQAIAQSPYGVPSHSRDQARATGIRVADAVGLPGAKATMVQLRDVPAQQLAQLQGDGLSLAPSLIVGDAAMPRPLLDAFRDGRQAAVPLIIGSNSDDASVALAFGLQPQALVKRLGAARILVGPLYPGVTDDAELGRQVVRDVVFTTFARRLAVLHAKRAPTWRYYFDNVPGGARADAPGAAHGAEVTAVFGTDDVCQCLGAPLTRADIALRERLLQRWVAFARGGKPDVPGSPAWPADGLWRAQVLAWGSDESLQPAFMRDRLNAFIGALRLVQTVQPAGR